MTRPRLLDLFCGAGGCAVGYHRAGFDVVGVDIAAQPRYPFEWLRQDAMEILQDGVFLSKFDVIHVSPPCQAYSVTRKIGTGRNHQDLVEPTRRMLQKSGKPWVIENVIGSPLGGAVLLCGTMFGLKVFRHRLFEASFLLLAPSHKKHPGGDNTGSTRGYSTGRQGYVCVAGNNFCRVAGGKAMGIDWMTRKEMSQAIPPVFAEYIGKQLMRVIR